MSVLLVCWWRGSNDNLAQVKIRVRGECDVDAKARELRYLAVSQHAYQFSQVLGLHHCIATIRDGFIIFLE